MDALEGEAPVAVQSYEFEVYKDILARHIYISRLVEYNNHNQL